jgi:pimeloyl-ACP methyl ester carboxylesterase
MKTPLQALVALALLGAFTVVLNRAVAATSQTPISLRTARVTVDGADVHYRLGGSGPPLLLLHGFMWSGRVWDRFADDLGQQFTLIIHDLPGHGNSTGLPKVWSARHVASQMFEFLDRLQYSRVSAIGCSGGAVALLHMALQKPDRNESMVIISGPHRLTDDVRRGFREIPAEEPKEWREWNRMNNPRGESQIQAMLALLRQFADNYEDFSTPLDQLSRIPARTLLASGDRDYGPTLEVAVELHRTIPHSSLWIVPNAGHDSFWSEIPGGTIEAEKAFVPVVLRFFQNQKEGGPGGAMSSRKK